MISLSKAMGAATGAAVKDPNKVVVGGSTGPTGTSKTTTSRTGAQGSGSKTQSSGGSTGGAPVVGGYNPNLTSSGKKNTSTGGSSGTSVTKNGGSTNNYAAPVQTTPQLPALNQYGYRDMDYTTAIQKATSDAERTQLMQERANKIKYQYGGVEPYMTGTTQKFSETQAGRTNNTAFDNNFAQNTFSAGVNYADEAAKHAAQGDWGAVEQDLIQRQAKIDAQGGNNRGLTNRQLLQQLQQQYGATYAQLSQRDQDRMTLISGGKLPFTAYNGAQGNIELGSGWQQGVDYLAQAQQYAQLGDLDGAYDALMRRGFKMYDTGSTGNGISQDQAYAMIDSIWRSSPQAQQMYQREMDQNARWIAESGAKAGNPNNAYKTLRKGNYWITYDGNGNPVIAGRVSSKVGSESKHTTYTPDQIDYLAKYYSGQAGDYSQAYIPAHNIMVTQTGVGRLIDNYGNYASGESPVSTNVKGYTGSLYAAGANANQDRAALASVQQRIDAGEQFGALGPSTGTNGSVPIATTTPLPGNSVIGGSGSVGGGIGGGSGSGNYAPGTSDVYTPGNMGDYLNQWYQNAQQQQQNTIDFGTNQAILELLRTKQDAEAQYQEQRNQIAIDEAKAKDNQALYAEVRGDKGGIGAAQYDAIMNTAAQNRLAVNSAQTKLATDTSRQIADLRAQGEYEKADALLTLSQQYLSQLMSLEQWAAEYNLSVAQFNASLQQWQAEYELKVADILGSYRGQQTLSGKQFEFNQQQYMDEQQAAQEKKLASAGEILLAAGIMPSASQLAAMGLTETEAQSYITAQKVAAAASAKGNGSGTPTGNDTGTPASPDMGDGAYALFLAARESGDDPYTYIKQKANYQRFGLTSAPTEGRYTAWEESLSDVMGADSFQSFLNKLNTSLSESSLSSVDSMTKQAWPTLTTAQRQAVQNLYKRYGYAYSYGA